MKLYAERPRYRTQQVLNDIVIALWITVWVRVGVIVHDVVAKLAAPGRSVERAGRTVADGAANVSGNVSDVPLVGDDLSSAFDSLADAGGDSCAMPARRNRMRFMPWPCGSASCWRSYR